MGYCLIYLSSLFWKLIFLSLFSTPCFSLPVFFPIFSVKNMFGLDEGDNWDNCSGWHGCVGWDIIFPTFQFSSSPSLTTLGYFRLFLFFQLDLMFETFLRAFWSDMGLWYFHTPGLSVFNSLVSFLSRVVCSLFRWWYCTAYCLNDFTFGTLLFVSHYSSNSLRGYVFKGF